MALKFARILAYALPQWRMLAVILGLTLVASALAALQPLPLKILVDYGFGDEQAPEALVGLLALIGVEPGALAYIVAAAVASVGLVLLAGALDAGLTLAWSRAGQRMVYALAGDLFLRLQRLSLIFHSRRTVGDSLTRVTGDSWCAYALAEGLFIGPVKQLMIIASVGVVAWQLDPGLTLITLVAVPLLAVSARYFGNRLMRIARRTREAIAQVTSLVHQVLGGMPVVQAYAAASRNRATFDALAQRAVDAQRASAIAMNAYGAVNGVATTLAVALIIYAGGTRVLAAELTLGSLLVFIAYVRTLESAARELFDLYGGLRTAEAKVDRVLEVLDSADTLTERPGAAPIPARGQEPSGRLVFDCVTFGYEENRAVIEELTLEVQPGETLALVGTTGAGKTTLASLVPRFFDPWSGRILVDGADLRDVQVASLRSEIALVLQEPFILPLTVAENIAYGRPDASRESIVAAAQAANAHEFITRLPQGYDTVLAEQGATLSGGQRQRISIARAVLKDARILILDEPTSALDPDTENAVVEALARLMAGRTTLIITHRLTLVRHADRVAVLAHGRIAELGTHAELLAQRGRYAELYALQAAPEVSLERRT